MGSRDMWIAKPVYCLKYKLAEAIPNAIAKSTGQTPIQLQANGNISWHLRERALIRYLKGGM